MTDLDNCYALYGKIGIQLTCVYGDVDKLMMGVGMGEVEEEEGQKLLIRPLLIRLLYIAFLSRLGRILLLAPPKIVMGSDSTEKVTQVRKRALFGMCNVVMALSFFALVARFSSSSYSAHSAIRRGLRKFGVTRHCYIVRQSLFGNHETDREHATLNWWNDAALLSIHRAAEWAGAEVHVIMR